LSSRTRTEWGETSKKAGRAGPKKVGARSHSFRQGSLGTHDEGCTEGGSKEKKRVILQKIGKELSGPLLQKRANKLVGRRGAGLGELVPRIFGNLEVARGRW